MSKRAWPDGPWLTEGNHEKVRMGFEIGFPSINPNTRNWDERDAHYKAVKDLIELAPEMAEGIIELIESYLESQRAGVEPTDRNRAAVTKLVELSVKLTGMKKLTPTLEVPQ